MVILSRDAYFTAGINALCEQNDALSSLNKIIFDTGADNIYVYDVPTSPWMASPLAHFFITPKIILPRTSTTKDFIKTFTLREARTRLTKREVTVLRYLTAGVSTQRIAQFLSLSEKTVTTHKSNALYKLQINNLNALIMNVNLLCLLFSRSELFLKSPFYHELVVSRKNSRSGGNK